MLWWFMSEWVANKDQKFFRPHFHFNKNEVKTIIIEKQNYQNCEGHSRGTPPDVRGTTFYTLGMVYTPGTPVLSTDNNNKSAEKNIQRYREG